MNTMNKIKRYKSGGSVKRLFNSLIILFLLIVMGNETFSQHFMETVVPEKRNDFAEIVKSFNEYWEGKDYTERGKGWKQFKRWEWFWQTRLTQDGKLPNHSDYFRELQNHRQSGTPRKNKSDKTMAASWTSLGPSASPGGYAGLGRLNCVAVHPTNSNILWVGAASGGLWKTTNGGGTWTTNTDGLASIGISDIAIDPNPPYTTMYIATGDRDAGDTYSVGVLKSTDGGSNWSPTGLNWDTGDYYVIGRILIDPSNSNILIAATNGGIWRSTNGGTNWSMVQNGNFKDLEFKPGNSSVAYASGTGVYKSSNNGQTWSVLSTGLPASGVNRYAIAVSADNAAKIYVLASRSDNNGLKGVYVSDNEGTSFTEVKNQNSPNLLGWKGDGSDAGGQGWYDLCIAVSPLDEDLVYVGGVNIWVSTNGGSGWTPCAIWTDHPSYNPGSVYPVVHADHHDLYFIPGTSSLFSCHDGGINITENSGASWTYIGSGIRNSQFYKFGTYRSNSSLLIGGCQDVGTKLKNGSSWSDVIGGDGMECLIAPTNSSVMWGSLYYGDLRKSTDGGTVFSQKMTGINESGNWVTPFAIHPTDINTLYAGYINIWKTTNGGTSWGKTTSFAGSNKFSILKIAKANPDYIIAGYCIGSSNTVKLSTNSGSSWATVSVPNGIMTDLEFDPNDVNTLYISYGGYNNPGNKVLYSTNSGANWSNISGNLPDVPVNCLFRDYDNAVKRLYVGTDIGVWYCDNHSSTWVDYNDGLPTVVITELYINDLDDKLQAATYGRGLWETGLASTPTKISLVNPANDSKYINPADVEFKWREQSGASSYRLQVSVNSNMSSPVIDQSGISDTSVIISSLNYYTKYYWRVLPSGVDTYDWSDVWSFTTRVGIPVLTSPADGAKAVSLATGKLQWQAVTGAETYFLQIATTDLFDTEDVVFEDNTISQVLFNLSGADLDYNTVYYWRVSANGADGQGAVSVAREFKTQLATPVLIEPDTASMNIPVSGQLIWNTVPGATSYKLVASVNANLGSPVINQANVTDTSYDYSNLKSNTKYYWAVTAVNAEGESNKSAVWFFTTTIAVPTLHLPADKSANIMVMDTIIWRKVSGATSYDVQISADSGFVNIVFEKSSTTDTIAVYDGLDNSIKYYWRVKAKNSTAETEWSGKWEFTTIFAPPVLVSPENNAVDIELKGKLVFEKINEAKKYKIQLSTKQDFSGGIVYNQDIDSVFLDFENLTNGTAYYWRVLAYSTAGTTTGWSEVWSFTTKAKAGTPELVMPSNNATNQPIDLSLSWKEITGAEKYHLMVAKDNLFTNILKDETNLTDNGYDLNSLAYDTKYYWKVRVFMNGDFSEWSAVWNFTTIKETVSIAKPVLLMPANNATGIKTDGNLVWKKVANAQNYTVMLSKNQDFSINIININVNDSLKSFAGLEKNVKYYWKVKAIAGGNESEWSDTWSFTTEKQVNIPDKIGLVFPPHNKDKIKKTDKLQWGSAPGAISYTLQISKQKSFQIVEKTVENIKDTFYIYAGLTDGSRYYWRVKAVYNGNETGWSDVWSFFTESPLAIPALLTPVNNSPSVYQDLKLEWEAVTGAEFYGLQVSTDIGFNDYSGDVNPVIIDETNITNTFSEKKFNKSTKYYWRVNQGTAGVLSAWSDIWSFTTDDVFGVDDKGKFIDYLSVSPNPAGNNAVIEFSITGNSSIELTVCNSLGEIVIKPQFNLNAGNNARVPVSFAGLPEGVYFIRLNCLGESKTVKVVVIK